MPQLDIGYLFFLILLNQGKTKEDKEYCKQDQLEGGSQPSNEEVSKPGRVSSENNRKAAKSLAGDSQDINHGWDTTVCCVPKVQQPIEIPLLNRFANIFLLVIFWQ